MQEYLQQSALLLEKLLNDYNYSYVYDSNKFTINIPNEEHNQSIIKKRFASLGLEIWNVYSYKHFFTCKLGTISFYFGKLGSTFEVTADISDIIPVHEFDKVAQYAFILNSTFLSTKCPGYVYLNCSKRRLEYRFFCLLGISDVIEEEFNTMIEDILEFVITCKNQIEGLHGNLPQADIFMNSVYNNNLEIEDMYNVPESSNIENLALKEKIELREEIAKNCFKLFFDYCESKGEDKIAAARNSVSIYDEVGYNFYLNNPHRDYEIRFYMDINDRSSIFTEVISKSYSYTKQQVKKVAVTLNLLNKYLTNARYYINPSTGFLTVRCEMPLFQKEISFNTMQILIEVGKSSLINHSMWFLPYDIDSSNYQMRINEIFLVHMAEYILHYNNYEFEIDDIDSYTIEFKSKTHEIKGDSQLAIGALPRLEILALHYFEKNKAIFNLKEHEINVALNMINLACLDGSLGFIMPAGINMDDYGELELFYNIELANRYIAQESLRLFLNMFTKQIVILENIVDYLCSANYSVEGLSKLLHENVQNSDDVNEKIDNNAIAENNANNFMSALKAKYGNFEKTNTKEGVKVTTEIKTSNKILELEFEIKKHKGICALDIYYIPVKYNNVDLSNELAKANMTQEELFIKTMYSKVAADNLSNCNGIFTFIEESGKLRYTATTIYNEEYFDELYWMHTIERALLIIDTYN